MLVFVGNIVGVGVGDGLGAGVGVLVAPPVVIVVVADVPVVAPVVVVADVPVPLPVVVVAVVLVGEVCAKRRSGRMSARNSAPHPSIVSAVAPTLKEAEFILFVIKIIKVS